MFPVSAAKWVKPYKSIDMQSHLFWQQTDEIPKSTMSRRRSRTVQLPGVGARVLQTAPRRPRLTFDNDLHKDYNSASQALLSTDMQKYSDNTKDVTSRGYIYEGQPVTLPATADVLISQLQKELTGLCGITVTTQEARRLLMHHKWSSVAVCTEAFALKELSDSQESELVISGFPALRSDVDDYSMLSGSSYAEVDHETSSECETDRSWDDCYDGVTNISLDDAEFDGDFDFVEVKEVAKESFPPLSYKAVCAAGKPSRETKESMPAAMGAPGATGSEKVEKGLKEPDVTRKDLLACPPYADVDVPGKDITPDTIFDAAKQIGERNNYSKGFCKGRSRTRRNRIKK